MRNIIFILILFSTLNSVAAQENTLGPFKEYTVSAHKEQLKLTLLIDSIQIGNKVEKLNLRLKLDINYESDYLQIADNYYVKIFFGRNQEYGKKFYTWRWDYLQKKGKNYNLLGASSYTGIEFNQPISTCGRYGQGMGTEGASDYLMFYYRYILE
jgi:hypothetical protein